MALEIVFTKRADKKLDNILHYLQNEWSVKVAGEFIETLYITLDNIVVFPEIGLIINDEKQIRAFLITKHTKLYYRIEKGKLIVLNFIDTRKKPNS